MENMVEPDRTIMIVSIIGLVVLWGSFFYHKFVQGGAESAGTEDVSVGGEQNVVDDSDNSEPESVPEVEPKPQKSEGKPAKSGKKKGKKRR
tara:strand:- start:377 stop:649 length:273 start_codon:yes stop_codon:yes gene_type:complete